MEARNCQELGVNLQKIINRLLANDNLINLLYYTDLDPLNQPQLDTTLKNKEVFNKLIKIVPKVGTKDNAQSLLAVYISSGIGLSENSEFRRLVVKIDIYTPLTQWIIKDSNLRPFAIMGEIQRSLNGKTVNGLGKLKCGDFNLVMITEDVSCYTMEIPITEYD
jgi:hypothetical protein